MFGKADTSTVNLSDVASGVGGFVINGSDSSDFSGGSVSNAGDVNGDGFDDLINSLKALPLNQISSRQEADEYLKTSVQPESLRQFLLQNLKNSEDGFRWQINLDAIQANIDALMDFPDDHRNMQYQKSVLFLKGEKSDYINHQYKRQIFKIFPNALFITVAGAGHWLHAENPGFVVNEIRKFIK